VCEKIYYGHFFAQTLYGAREELQRWGAELGCPGERFGWCVVLSGARKRRASTMLGECAASPATAERSGARKRRAETAPEGASLHLWLWPPQIRIGR
jgi:hypothetical protein